MIGKQISHYKITHKLGEGGMGVVYRAQDTRLKRDVALKFLHADLVRSESDRKRFFREAEALALLEHPNICNVYELDEADGLAFIVMGFIDGKPLREVVEKEPMAIDDALEMIRQVASGIQAAHDHGIVHRDIKSNNVIVGHDGQAKILDFGLAKLSERSLLTKEGIAVGTLVYMSPEQSTAGTVDHRSDIWSLGVLLYELVTGEFPFYAQYEQAIVFMILNNEPKPLVALRDDIPPGLQEIIDKALSKKVEERFQSVAEMIDAIDYVIEERRKNPEAVVTKGAAETKVDGIPSNTIAVLDFSNLSGNPQDDWLSGGMAESIATDLRRVASLRLVGRRRIVKTLMGRRLGDLNDEEVATLGTMLRARWILWGGYKKFGDSIRIAARLSDTYSSSVVDSYESNGVMDDVFSLQDGVVEHVLRVVDVEFTTAELARSEQDETTDGKAYEYYARGRATMWSGAPDRFEKAKDLFEKAIELDPGYAAAHAGLGSNYVGVFISKSDPQVLKKAMAHLEKAIELDPAIAEPHMWLCYFLWRKGDLDAAIASGRRAVELESDHHLPYYFLYAPLLEKMIADGYSYDHAKEIIELIKESVELEPKYQPSQMALGFCYTLHGQYESARAPLEKAVELEQLRTAASLPFVGAQTAYGNLLFRLSQPSPARLSYQKSLTFLKGSKHPYADLHMAGTYNGLGDIEYTNGQYGDALSYYGKAIEMSRTTPEKVGMGYVFVRATSGMSKSYFRIDMRRESKEKLSDARKTFETKEGFSFQYGGETDPQASFQIASACATLGLKDDAIDYLEYAVRHGWRELQLLEADETLMALAGDPRFDALLEELRTTKPLP